MILAQFLFAIKQDKIIYGDEAVIRLRITGILAVGDRVRNERNV